MPGVRLQYIRLELRLWLLCMKRRLFVIAALFLAFVLLLGACYLRLGDDRKPALLGVALVIPGEQKEIVQLAKLLQLTDSVKHTIAFVYADEEEARDLLAKGSIQAAILFGEDFYEDVDTGVNTPVQILLGEKVAGIDLFRELMADMVTLVDVTEAASYAMIDAHRIHDASMSLGKMQNRIFDDNVALLLEARRLVRLQMISPTGEVALAQYYAASLYLLFLLVPGLGFWCLYAENNRIVEEKLRLYGVGRVFRSACKLVMMTAVETVYALAGMGICQGICRLAGISIARYDGYVAGWLLLVSLCLACLFCGILQLGGARRERRILVASVVLFFLIAGGCIVPCAYLPGWLDGLVAWTPFYQFRDFLEGLMFDRKPSCAGMLLWACAFLLAGEGIGNLLGRRKASESAYAQSRSLFAQAYRSRDFGGRCLALWLYIKWQMRRKTPVAVAFALLALMILCLGIHLPRQNSRTILVGGDDELCREMERDGAGAFHFVHESDEKERAYMAKSGQVLAAVDFSEGEIRMNTARISPEIFVAKETVALAYYKYAQRTLLAEECRDVFVEEEVYGEVMRAFDRYMKANELFRVEYRTE